VNYGYLRFYPIKPDPAAAVFRPSVRVSAGPETTLELHGKAPLRRTLKIEFSPRFSYLTVMVFLPKQTRMLAYVHDKMSTARLDSQSLWVGHTAFDITTAEAERIRATFEPLGLRLEPRGCERS
jgi:hypothetical protein